MELKSFIVLYNGKFIRVYKENEADKVIAELKEKHFSDLQDAEDSFKSILELNRKELRHHKYRRCLAMASRCRLRGRLFGACGLYEKELWALKWHKRWLELAEKFKEAK